jgi:hypothetical protein
MNNTNKIGISVFCLNIGDLVTTLIALNLGAIELNPLFNLGQFWFITIKLIIPSCLVLGCCLLCFYFKIPKTLITMINITLLILVLIFGFAVINNIIVIIKQ